MRTWRLRVRVKAIHHDQDHASNPSVMSKYAAWCLDKTVMLQSNLRLRSNGLHDLKHARRHGDKDERPSDRRNDALCHGSPIPRTGRDVNDRDRQRQVTARQRICIASVGRTLTLFRDIAQGIKTSRAQTACVESATFDVEPAYASVMALDHIADGVFGGWVAPDSEDRPLGCPGDGASALAV